MTTVTFAASAMVFWGCGMAPSGPGVTTGGQQDIAAARSVIEDGGVPDPDWITVEGFLSEHSIPIEEPEDAGLLYTVASVAWNADFDVFTPVATVAIGFGTTIDEDTFERDPLNLCLVIDSSGSMAWQIDERSGTSKLDAVKIAIDRLLAQLDDDDCVSIVSFTGTTKLWVEAVPGDDIASIKSALDKMEAEGGTDLANGLRRGYRVVKAQHNAARSDRLIVFTDALLIGPLEREAAAFIEVMEQYAKDDIGATLFGIGTDFGHEIAYDISQVRGGNYFFLSDYDRIVTVFDEEFDYLVTPVAYDVSLDVSVPFEWDIVGVYGIPVEDALPHVLELDIPTLFLSTRQGGGGALVRIRPGALVDFSVENMVAHVSLSYTTREGEQETHPAVTAVLPGGFDPEGTINYFENDGTKRAVLLLNTALVLHNACDDVYPGWYYSSAGRNRAIDRLTEFLPYFDALAKGLEDRASETSRSLSQERTLVAQLLTNIRDW
ncbi:MAG: VWA domain-containing protein [Phycisphaerae bacterium]